MTTTNKGLIQPANGSYVDTWDQPVNNDWSYIDTAFGGAVSLNATGISAHTLTLTEYRPLIIEVTGAISNNVVYTIPSGIGGQWIVINNTTDATGGPWTISFTCAGSGYSISCPRATTTNLMCDGVNVNFADGRPGSPGGSNTQVQYNNNGTLAGSSNFVFTGTNVGIGTSSPVGKLDILTGTNRGFFDDSAGSLFRLNSVNAANSVYAPLGLNGSVLTFEINATESARIDSSGNVGIGTTSPSARLNILSAGGWTSSNWGKGFYVNTSGSACNPAIGISDYTGSNNWAIVNLSGALTFNTGPAITDSTTAGVERMRIDSSGNVGIGTTSPGQNLTVVGSIEATNIIIADNQIQFGSNSNIWYQAGGNQATLRSGASGNYTYFNFISNAQIPLIGGSTLTFSGNSGSNEHMRIATNGSVGIGDSNPFSTLSISNTGNTGYNMPISATFRALSGALNAAANSSNNLGTFSCTTTNASSLSVHVVRTANGSDWTTTSMGLTYDVDTTQAAGGGIWFNNGCIGINTLTPDQALTVNGYIHSTSGGFQFPDGTIQATAATGYTPPTAFSAIGTYAFLYYNGGIVASGGTVTSNGANLFPCDTNIANVSSIASGQVWQCMGYNGGYSATLWLRIS